MISFVRKKLSKLDVHTLEVVKKSSASMLVKVVGIAVGLLVSIFLGRTLGADGLGIINLVNQIISLFLVLTFLGMSKVIIKEIAIAHGEKNWQHIGNVMYTSYLINGGLTFLVSIILILSSHWISEKIFHEPRLTYPFIIGVIVMTPQIFSRIFSSALVGYRKIWQSNLVDQTLSIVVTCFILLLLWLLNYEITINRVAIGYAIGRIFVTLSIGFYWSKLFPHKNKRGFIGKKLTKIGLPLLIVSASLLISANADSIMLGWLNNATQVGYYTIASKIALLTSFFLQITVATVAPKIAILYKADKKQELEKMIQQISKGLTIIGFVSMMIFIFGGKFILGLWGAEFMNAYWILVILSIGQFFNIASGPVGNLLIMTGYEKIIRNVTIFTVLLNIILNYFLINKYQAVGAAIATSCTTILNMILCYYYVIKKIDIHIIKFR